MLVILLVVIFKRARTDARWLDETELEVSREDFWDLPI